MKKILFVLTLVLSAFLWSCQSETTIKTAPAQVIDAVTGKAMMDYDSTIILIDVRTVEEYEAEHIPGAINLPVEEIGDLIGDEITNKSTKIILYCRSGNRSAQAASILSNMGYLSVFDMGGIIDWPYATTLD